MELVCNVGDLCTANFSGAFSSGDILIKSTWCVRAGVIGTKKLVDVNVQRRLEAG